MAAQDLSISNNQGSQVATQDPQNSAASSSLAGQSTQNVQTGTATSVLNSSSGQSLQNLPPVPATLRTATQSTKVATTSVSKHTPNPALVGFAVMLFVVAIILFWATNRSAKNTTI